MNTCVFSEDRIYRYTLTSENKPGGYVNFIGLNPSTADETMDDPTIRKCKEFARRWGYNRICMTNLFAWRSTDPRMLRDVRDPVGRYNDGWLKDIAAGASLIVACWGRHGRWHNRAAAVRTLLASYELKCLYQNADGSPIHPLYVPYSTELQDFAT